MTPEQIAELTAVARAWRDQDPDEETREELDALITRADDGDEAAVDGLADRFSTRLAFGTAGLRGELGAGPNRMNRVLVSQAAAGFARYLLDTVEDTPSIIVGYDGRRNSHRFALDSAEIFAGFGLKAIILPRLLPTPVAAFALRHLNADAAVMVTASHNPPNDNGYKVFLGGSNGGSQIVAPADVEIAAQIAAVARDKKVGDLPRSSEYETADESVVDAYIARTAEIRDGTSAGDGFTWVYTAMHGVGSETIHAVAAAAGLPAPIVVAEQNEPDGTFPTVSFPNPEEPGALDLAFSTAKEHGANLIIANDPDADRLAVAIPDDSVEGGWRRLSGNDVGLLLGFRAAEQLPPGSDATLACSLVSSPGLEAVAKHFGVGYRETLTGFKWISRADNLAYGFEEALGYLVNPETVRDKDGISAAVAILDLAVKEHEAGRTIADSIADVGEAIGWYSSGQVSIRVEDLSIIGRVMASLRSEPLTTLGSDTVTHTDDLLQAAGNLPSGDVLRYTLASGSRVIVRPSGTEPKLKVYLDASASSKKEADERIKALHTAAEEMVANRS